MVVRGTPYPDYVEALAATISPSDSHVVAAVLAGTATKVPFSSFPGDGSGAGGGSGFTYITPYSDPVFVPAPEVGNTWFAPDTGNSYIRETNGSSTYWRQFASATTVIPPDPTLSGLVVVDGDLIVERSGQTSRIYIESDTAGYLVFATPDGNLVAYMDVATASGVLAMREGDGTTFFRYDPATNLVTFPDAQVPVAEINGAVEATSTTNKLHGPITQAAYDALTPDPNTLYVIVG